MARVKLNFPFNKPIHISKIPLRISDMNYGNHLGNDSVLSIIHESRVQFLTKWGYSELDIGGCGLIMADVMIAYKNEGYYGDLLQVEIFIEDISRHSFDMLFRLSTMRDGKQIDIAHAKTGMICFDYTQKKIAQMPTDFAEILKH